jgi:NADH:ubiquinone oxidoreductase subunit E
MPDGRELKFSEAALAEYRELLTHYPTRQAALLPALWIAQREFGWLSLEAQLYVSKLMEIPPAHVRGVVTFYTMYYQKPVGRWHLEVCTNVSCRLRGAEQIVDCIKERLGIEVGERNASRRAEPRRCFSLTTTPTTKTSPRIPPSS